VKLWELSLNPQNIWFFSTYVTHSYSA